MLAKAFVIADRSSKVNVKEAIAYEQVELVITLGSLTREDLPMFKIIVAIPKIGNYGNQGIGNYMDELGIWDMYLKVWNLQGLRFGGGVTSVTSKIYTRLCIRKRNLSA